jgi:hypothetical protein
VTRRLQIKQLFANKLFGCSGKLAGQRKCSCCLIGYQNKPAEGMPIDKLAEGVLVWYSSPRVCRKAQTGRNTKRLETAMLLWREQ